MSPAKMRTLKGDPAQDEALGSSSPVLWVPKDELGIVDNEIYYMKRAYNSIWISNEGTSLDERGKLKLCGPPPEFSK